MDGFETVMTAMLLDTLDQAGALGLVIDKAVNGTDKICLGWYDETDTRRAVVCAAFQVLGQEIADHCNPIVATIVINGLVNMRDNTIEAMKNIPR